MVSNSVRYAEHSAEADRTPSRTFAFSLASISLIGPLAVHMFMPVIPAVKAALELSEARAQLTFSIALFGMAFATLVYGSLADRYGRRPVLLSGLFLFLIGSAVSAVAPNAMLLILGRFIQAVGAGCGTTLVRAIARDAYGPERLVKAIAYLTMFYTMGPMIAPIVGGALIDAFGWRYVFGFALVVGAAIAWGAYQSIYETHPQTSRGKQQSAILASYLQLFGYVRFTAFVLQSGLSTGAFMTIASASATLMKDFLHRPSTEFGFYFLCFPVGYFLGNVVSSWVGGRRSNEAMVLTGSVLALTTITIQSVLLLSGHVSPVTIFVPGFFLTCAQGIALPYAQSGAISTIPKLAGTAAGIGVFAQNFCGAVFAQLYGAVATGEPFPMIAVAMLAAVLCFVAGALPMVQRRREAKREPAS